MNEIQLCNLALSLIGNKEITSLERPTIPEEKVCKLWFDITLKEALIKSSPNFARRRTYIPLDNTEPVFGYVYRYKKPNNCLKIIGIGEAQDLNNDYIVEGQYIETNYINENKIAIRYIYNETDCTKFSTGFINYFITLLAKNICYQLNKDAGVVGYLEQLADKRLLEANTEENQESKIKVISQSRYKQAMRTGTASIQQIK